MKIIIAFAISLFISGVSVALETAPAQPRTAKAPAKVAPMDETIRSIYCNEIFSKKFYGGAMKDKEYFNAPDWRQKAHKALGKVYLDTKRDFLSECKKDKARAEKLKDIEEETNICIAGCKGATGKRQAKGASCDQQVCEERCKGEKRAAEAGLEILEGVLGALD